MKQHNILQEQKAITLIALVITIVVMLILAGVTINLTLGENGIFTTAQQAVKNYTEAQDKELSYLEGFTNEVSNIVNPAPLGTIIKTENNINYTADGAENIIPVPVGFSPITTEDQGTRNTGFVIKNDTDGNEFVWVPVEDMNYKYDRVAWSREGWKYTQGTNGTDITTASIKITRADLDADTYYWIEKMQEDEQLSVNTYGGFYIGRYEAGIIGGTKDETLTNGTYYTGDNMKLVVKAGQQVWNYIDRDRALAEATRLYNKEANNVTSKLCSSYAWDTALKFIETQNSIYPTNSIGGYSEQTGLTTTGHDTTHPCNIYDMGGNVYEWTTESCSDTLHPYVYRGGPYHVSASNNPAATRMRNSNTYMTDYLSFRVTLFM